MRTGVPLYHQLKNNLLRDLQANRWRPGERIPSEAELAHEHAVSRITVRQAIRDLVDVGYLVRHQGKGTFVAERKRSPAASKLQGFAEELRIAGHDVDLNITRIEQMGCPDRVAAALQVPGGTEVTRISRIASVEEVPIFRETSYLLLPQNSTFEELTRHSQFYNHIYGFFEQHGVKITFGSQDISATKATYEDTKELHIALDEPILMIQRVTSDDAGIPVEFSEVRYPSSRYKYRVHLARGQGDLM
ncbi:GntR family transcriptional regulator [Alicyclobacillus cycloheptanicus]|uniref:GntR family transcriptional regulator n=1 Tax=Alicyclobacillus cycloheptanicus TaxID=1457 RepID=A0ABT9XLX5_9BACL|nr:GntR family transcriptional regulator [Alicyclobacillus cycloheptanicus]MDQ0190711.1 GntR family transcriptional regulator [Alicyclobacillus cycloheptanicus]WDL99890.1 GntR family transcriptional regulator [Alicyclobacillus cycloheptanicus]